MARWVQQVPVPSDPIPDGAIAVSMNVGFDALSIAIDNLTGYWVYLPEAQAYVPPWWVGVVRNPVHSTNYGYVQWKSPFGGPQTITTSGAVNNPGLTVMFTDYFVPYNSGSLIPTQSTSGSGVAPPPILVTVTNPCCDDGMTDFFEFANGFYAGDFLSTVTADAPNLVIDADVNIILTDTLAHDVQIVLDGVPIKTVSIQDDTNTGTLSYTVGLMAVAQALAVGVHTINLWIDGDIYFGFDGQIIVTHVATASLTVQSQTI